MNEQVQRIYYAQFIFIIVEITRYHHMLTRIYAILYIDVIYCYNDLLIDRGFCRTHYY